MGKGVNLGSKLRDFIYECPLGSNVDLDSVTGAKIFSNVRAKKICKIKYIKFRWNFIEI